VISYLLERGWELSLAAEGNIAALLSKEFPQLKVIPLKGYRITYPNKGALFIPKILLQVPKIICSISNEHQWLDHQLDSNKWDLIISDNRYGLYTTRTRTVFITHQLGIISGFGKLGDILLRTMLYRWINRFNTCWIPDAAGDLNIAGKLSHPLSMPNHYAFIGPLSRLDKKPTLTEGHLLVLLSGPEPQRTILENKLIDQLSDIDEEVVFARGLPSSAPLIKNRGRIRFENHLDAKSLSEMLSNAKAVICRSGYSSVMDLLKLKKRALLIPTPGQTEQVYLAKHLGALRWFVVQEQSKLDLKKGIASALSESIEFPALDFEAFKKAFANLGIQ
jgi:UDP-N-acetylglucosamine transferase subunit ALG13